jgi:hypothetical protein
MASKLTQNFLYLMAKGEIDLDTNSFIAILMDTGFTFLRGSYHKYSEISAYELATGNGYTVKTKVLTGISVARNDTLYKVTITWTNPAWVASGGVIGPSPGLCIIDDTHADDPIVGYIDFGGEGTEPDGGTFTITSPTIELTT